MITIENLILMLIMCCPRHELNRDAALRAEVAGYFAGAGVQYDIPPTLLVYWAYRESSLKTNVVGKLGEIGYGQVHGIARRTCQDGGHDPTTREGSIYCMAMLMDEGRRFCGSLESGLIWYASGSCRGSEKTRRKIKQRMKAWRRKI